MVGKEISPSEDRRGKEVKEEVQKWVRKKIKAGTMADVDKFLYLIAIDSHMTSLYVKGLYTLFGFDPTSVSIVKLLTNGIRLSSEKLKHMLLTGEGVYSVDIAYIVERKEGYIVGKHQQVSISQLWIVPPWH